MARIGLSCTAVITGMGDMITALRARRNSFRHGDDMMPAMAEAPDRPGPANLERPRRGRPSGEAPALERPRHRPAAARHRFPALSRNPALQPPTATKARSAA